MMLGKKALIILSALFALPLILVTSVQGATISSEESVEILALDGQALQGKPVNKKHIDVDAGRHQIVVRYYGNVKKGGKNVIYSTPPYIFSVNLKSTDEISVLAPRLSTYSQARAYFRQKPDWKIHYQNGRVKVVQYEQLTKKGSVSSANIEGLVAVYNQRRGNQLAPSKKNIVSRTLTETPAQPDDALVQTTDTLVQTTDTLIQTIQLLYNNASATQKETIKQWIDSQP